MVPAAAYVHAVVFSRSLPTLVQGIETRIAQRGQEGARNVVMTACEAVAA